MGLILILVTMFAPMGFVGLIKILKEKIIPNQSIKKQADKAILEEAA